MVGGSQRRHTQAASGGRWQPVVGQPAVGQRRGSLRRQPRSGILQASGIDCLVTCIDDLRLLLGDSGDDGQPAAPAAHDADEGD